MLPIHFAPIQGYTEAPYRQAHNSFAGGIDTYYTPFIRLEHGKIRPKDLREALPAANEGIHLVPQIIAASRDEFDTLAKILIEAGHRQLDFNMGCPFPLQVRQGRGSGLLQHRDKAEEILSAIAELTAEGIEVSVKMRLGQTSFDEGLSLIPSLNAAHLHHLTIHPRLGVEQYKGEIHHELMTDLLAQLTMPVVYNGEIHTVEDIIAIEQRYPSLQGVMIGRGLLSCPTLAREYVDQKTYTEAERRHVVMQMYRQLRQHYNQAIEGGERQLLLKMQSFFEYLEPLYGHKPIKKVLKAGSLRNFDEAVANLPK